MAARPQRQHPLDRSERAHPFLRPHRQVAQPVAPPPIAPRERFEPPWIERLWVRLVCLALKPFSWLHRCKCCWRGRLRAKVGHQPDHLVVLYVCPVCNAARPVAFYLQPASHRKHALACRII